MYYVLPYNRFLVDDFYIVIGDAITVTGCKPVTELIVRVHTS